MGQKIVPPQDMLELIAHYLEKVMAFKEDMADLGIQVKVTAQIGPFRSEIPEEEEP